MPLTLVGPVTKAEKTPEGMRYAALIQSSEKSATLDMDAYLPMLRAKKLQLPPTGSWQKHPLATAADGRSLPGEPRRSERLLPRIAVFGDSDFLTDAQLGPMQATLGYFTFNWLAGESDMVQLPAPPTEVTPIILGPNQRNFISILTVVVLPFAVFFGGLAYTTIRRRKR